MNTLTVQNSLMEVDRIRASDRIPEWIESLERNLSPHTVSAYTKGLRLFSEFMAIRSGSLQIARAKDLEEWREDLKPRYSKSSINLWLTGIRQFYAFHVALIQDETGILASNPMARVKGIKNRGGNGSHKRDDLTSAEINRLFETCEERSDKPIRDKAIISLMAFAALRTIEINRADIEDIRTKDDRIILDVQGKGQVDKSQFVVVSAMIESALNDWLAIRGAKSGPLFISLSRANRGERLSTKSIRWMIKERFKVAGINGSRKSTHSLRHSAITSAIRGGATPQQVMNMARHQSYDTTLGYFHEMDRVKFPAEDLISYSIAA